MIGEQPYTPPERWIPEEPPVDYRTDPKYLNPPPPRQYDNPYQQPNPNPGGMGFWMKQPDGSWIGGDTFTGQKRPIGWDPNNPNASFDIGTRQPIQPVTIDPGVGNPGYDEWLARHNPEYGMPGNPGYVRQPITSPEIGFPKISKPYAPPDYSHRSGQTREEYIASAIANTYGGEHGPAPAMVGGMPIEDYFGQMWDNPTTGQRLMTTQQPQQAQPVTPGGPEIPAIRQRYGLSPQNYSATTGRFNFPPNPMVQTARSLQEQPTLMPGQWEEFLASIRQGR